jgi:hypothetical protein
VWNRVSVRVLNWISVVVPSAHFATLSSPSSPEWGQSLWYGAYVNSGLKIVFARCTSIRKHVTPKPSTPTASSLCAHYKNKTMFKVNLVEGRRFFAMRMKSL